MILYNITVNVAKEIEPDWLTWMREVHIPQIMDLGFFSNSKIFRLMKDEPDGMTYSCQFFAEKIADVMVFQSQHAQSMQNEVTSRYGDQVIDFRTVLEQV